MRLLGVSSKAGARRYTQFVTSQIGFPLWVVLRRSLMFASMTRLRRKRLLRSVRVHPATPPEQASKLRKWVRIVLAKSSQVGQETNRHCRLRADSSTWFSISQTLDNNEIPTHPEAKQVHWLFPHF
jgi:hypothetical protein